MKTIINVGLGLALAFCLVFFVSGSFEEYVDTKGKTMTKKTITELKMPNVNGWETAKSDFLA